MTTNLSILSFSTNQPSSVHIFSDSYEIDRSNSSVIYFEDAFSDRKVPNAKTRKVLEETDKGIGLMAFDNVDDLFKHLGI